MSDEDIPMAQCGACDSIIPLDSESCPNCGVHFGGITEEELGECGRANQSYQLTAHRVPIVEQCLSNKRP